MQPHALEVGGGEAERVQLLQDHGRDQRHDFLEDLSAFLNEQLVGLGGVLGRGAVQEAEIVADIVGELRLQVSAEDAPAAIGQLFARHQNRGGDIAEDEVGVAVAEIEVARADFRVHDQDGAGMAAADHVRRGLQSERG